MGEFPHKLELEVVQMPKDRRDVIVEQLSRCIVVLQEETDANGYVLGDVAADALMFVQLVADALDAL